MTSPLATWSVKGLALLLIGLAVGIPTAFTNFQHSSRDVVIGAHNATVRPSFDGFVTLDFGPVLPRMRIPSGQPLDLGVAIDLGDSQVSNLDQLAARDALIASQPEGEIAKVTSTVVAMARDASLRGLGAGVLAALGAILVWSAVGPERRAALWVLGASKPNRRQIIRIMAIGVTASVSLVLVIVPHVTRSITDVTGDTWTKLRFVVPTVPKDPILDNVEVSQGAASKGGEALLEGAVKTYRASVEFYGKLAKVAGAVSVRVPKSGETTALVVTDRHDNIGMDKVARAIAGQARSTMLIDLGDDTSSGSKWEDFSINSLAKAFKGFTVVAVAGNHDTGPFIREEMRDSGFKVLVGKARTIEGIRFLGSSDPRSSGLTAGYSGNEADSIKAIRTQDDAITTAACKDGSVSVILAHAPSSVSNAAASGCA
ncbi:MAG: metallophosphoesterase, partial [Aeromicrobium sp.]